MGAEAFRVSRASTDAGEPPAAAILARKEFWSLERWLSSEAATTLGLRDIEVEEEQRGRQLLRCLLQSHLDGRGDGDVGTALRVFGLDGPEEAVLYTHKRLHTRSVVTLFGEVSVTRMGYGRPGRPSIHPLDAQLQLPARTYSYELQRRLVKKAVQGPFDEAVEGLNEATGVHLPKRSAEEIVIDASVDFERFYSQRQGPGTSPGGPILVGSIDCKGIPMVKSELAQRRVRRRKGEKSQKKRMATVAAVFTQERYVRTAEEVVERLFTTDPSPARAREKASRPERKRIWASLLAGKEAFIQDVKQEMNRRDPGRSKVHVVVTDGERALQRRVCACMRGVLLILDLLHVLENLWKASHALHPEGSAEAEAFVRERALRILRGEVSQVVKGLRQIVTKRKLRGQKRKTLLKVAAYYYRNRPRMEYDDYLEQGLPIASGSVEGACKNLIKDRMERSGMRWTPRMAEAMVKMRAIYLSGDFEEYWDYHIAEEQQRLHPKGRWQPLRAVVRK